MEKDDILLLHKAGFVSSKTGGVLLSGDAMLVYDTILKLIKIKFNKFYRQSVYAPNLIDKVILKKAKYDVHFPHHLLNVFSHKKGSFETSIPPAACFHVFGVLENRKISKENSGYLVLSSCGRFENNKIVYPYRLMCFSMLEIVLFESSNEIEKLYKEILQHTIDFLDELELSGSLVTATDSFFAGENEGARVIQKIKELKKEYIVNMNGENIPILSINKHENYFCDNFNIRMGSATDVFSMCLAFGLERIVACCLLKWGLDKINWPKMVKNEILQQN